MKILIVLSCAALLLAIGAKDLAANPPQPQANQPPPELVAGANRFAIEFYRRWTKDAAGSAICSPYSISTAMAMTYAGAGGKTAEQMADTLHFSLPPDKLAAAEGALLQHLAGDGAQRPYQLHIADRLWVEKDYTLLDSFLKLTRDDFAAEAATADFSHAPEPTRAEINTWVAKQTNDRIKELFARGDVNGQTRLVLANAIYFKGDWQSPFNKKATQKAPFHQTAEKSADAALMHKIAGFRFSHVEHSRMLEMPYKGREVSMVILLPDRIDGLADVEKSLDSQRLDKRIAGLQEKKVNVLLPKFKATSDIDLGPLLSAMGMPRAFTGEADFSGMNGRHDLFLSKAIHKAFVEVDETGTEAAAATGIAVKPTAIARPMPMEEFLADHPFLFLIRDTRSGLILFIGRYTGPS